MGFLKRCCLAVIITLPVAYFVAWMTYPSLPDLLPFQTAAKKYDVEILRDEYGVPHIYGKNDTDTVFGLAYAHAEDDFATIQDVILATRGNIAAEKGFDAAKTDFLINFMGVSEAITAKYSSLPEDTRQIAEAYADGLNLYAAKHPDVISPWLLPVKGQDIIAGFTFKTPLFYGFDQVMGELFSGELVKEHREQMSNSGQTAFLWGQEDALPTGSQGIAVAPHRSDDGHTRLLVNSHQPLTGPVAWYEARLKSENGLDIAGSTFPGAPLIIHGHNQNVGWSNTVNKPDLVDVYELAVDDLENPTKYLLDGEWLDFDIRTAPIVVKVFGHFRLSVNKEILISKHGPALQTDDGVFAVRWAGMGEVRTLDFLYRINQAENLDEFISAFDIMAMPSINYVYADSKGNIGHLYNAMMPKREVTTDWQGILPGDDSTLIWSDYWPVSKIPHTQNPPSGMVYNANNSPFNASEGDGEPDIKNFPASMGLEMQWTNRARRIEELFKSDPSISAQDFHQYKFDTRYSEHSDVIVKLKQFLEQGLPEGLQQEPYISAFDHLQQWNLDTDKNNRQAALAILTLQESLKYGKKGNEAVNIATEFVKAVDLLLETHATVDIPYGQINRHVRGNKSLPISGGPDVLRAVYGDLQEDSGILKNRAGDSYVMFVEWDEHGKVNSSSVHNFGSATLDQASAHYDDQMELFTDHDLKPVRLSKADIENHLSRRYRPQD
ncbi:penicillin acylase family protein [uncultured Endozoicomonas sp.]|uniref:penicillin acylase family protein n=1 Tax=uncultured Endozoicomonas sp. TaxID=432652 RepID=UPI0026330650|nr:penicillin acylase family protein [uncultured Endozoicomonas sp.]